MGTDARDTLPPFYQGKYDSLPFHVYWSSDDYIFFDRDNKRLTIAGNRSSETLENIGLNITFTTDSSYILNDDITYSSARGSSAAKIVSTYSGTTGAFSNL